MKRQGTCEFSLLNPSLLLVISSIIKVRFGFFLQNHFERDSHILFAVLNNQKWKKNKEETTKSLWLNT
uniref:Uncharacterized protein n=1 Tax=Lepeophtheirus salmonis TaxID=72036 RepID=A0A0K2URQ3_LEPSM